MSESFSNIFEDATSIEQLLTYVVGAGSVCWEHPEGAGEFNEERANLLVDHALLKLISLMQEEFLRAVEESQK